MVVFVNHNDTVALISCDTGWQVELSVSCPLRSELGLESSVSEKNLDAIVATIRDDNFVVFVDADAPRS